MTSSIEIIEVAVGSSLFSEVVALADANRRYLGFMSPEAWSTYASRGRLLAAVRRDEDGNQELLGLASYRHGSSKATLAHLAVAKNARKQGIAGQLVAEVSRRTNEVHALVVSCRRDFPANDVWPRLGFVPFGERQGRGREAKTLTTWKLLHGQRDLFTWSGSESYLTAAIDTNLFIDIHEPVNRAANHEHVVRELQNASHSIELVVTPELFAELDRNPDDAARQRLKQIAAGYPQINIRRQTALDLLPELLGRTPALGEQSRDISDAVQVAYAVAGGVSNFVTSDGAAISKLGGKARDMGVEMLRPLEALVRAQLEEDGARYAPASLHGLDTQLEDDPVTALRSLMRLNVESSGERKLDLRRTVETLWSQGGTRVAWVLQDGEGTPLGGLAASQTVGKVDVAAIRVRAGLSGDALAMFLVGQLRRTFARNGLCEISVADSHLSTVLRDALEYHGFARIESGYHALAVDGLYTVDGLRSSLGVRAAVSSRLEEQFAHEFVDSTASSRDPSSISTEASERLIRLERRFGPVAIIDPGIEVWSVPIRAHFAYELLGQGMQLMPRRDSLGLSVEHVYYSSAASVPPSGARVLWYSSGDHDPGYTHHSIVIRSERLSWNEAYKKYRRLGVYSRDQVRKAANSKGQVSVIHFGDTRPIPKPLRLTPVNQLASEVGVKIVLRSPWRIPGELARRLMEDGYGPSRAG